MPELKWVKSDHSTRGEMITFEISSSFVFFCLFFCVLFVFEKIGTTVGYVSFCAKALYFVAKAFANVKGKKEVATLSKLTLSMAIGEGRGRESSIKWKEQEKGGLF